MAVGNLKRAIIVGLCLISLISVTTVEPRANETKTAKTKITFEEHVLPIFKARCIRCHAGTEPEAGLRLATARDVLRGGMSGTAIRIAAAESSLIWEKLAGNEMPKGGPPLSAEEKGIIRTWINDGAESSDKNLHVDGLNDLNSETSVTVHWSFLPPQKPTIPGAAVQRKRNDHSTNSAPQPVHGPADGPVDAFILSALNNKGLTPSPEATRNILGRRAYFDLLGIPPSPSAMEEFVADTQVDAFDRLLDRLLANPHYGERWGRHWLDVAGYADSAGVLSEDRPLPTAFRYRDYVIRAFNSDKPYDRFLQEQIAGDELSDYWDAFERQEQLPEAVVEAVTATGFLRCAPDSSRPDFSTIKNADAQYFYPTINDTLQILASSTMGLTVQCARCHSHKYDPIPQVDFYRFQAILMSAMRPKQWVPQMDRKILLASATQKKSADEHNANLDAEIKRVKQHLTELRTRFKQRLSQDRLTSLPEQIRSDVQQALSKPAEQRTEIDKYLVTKFQVVIHPDDKALDKLLPETYAEYRQEFDARNGEVARHEGQRRSFDEIRALYDLPGPVNTPLLHRGDALTPGPEVEPGVLSALATPVAFDWKPPPPQSKSSGRRLSFARWLTQSHHPLTARVIVNRVWLNHFGEGIVSTPEDFGTLGSAPSHPELLDWLACDLVENEWSLKRLHRLMMSSNTYRQQSNVGGRQQSTAMQVDPDNRLLWRQRLRRLEAEPIRDAMLSVAGLLDEQFFGSPVSVARRADGEVNVADGQNDRRRSVYLQVLRGHPLTILHTHDQPVMETNCTRRSRSTVATQALTLLNSDTAVSFANGFADRILGDAPRSPVEYAVQCALARSASPQEIEIFNDFVALQQTRYLNQAEAPEKAGLSALADLCQMLLVSNEFLYVD